LFLFGRDFAAVVAKKPPFAAMHLVFSGRFQSILPLIRSEGMP
jgi:hypothetical protein